VTICCANVLILESEDFALPISDSCISIMLSMMFLLMKAVSLPDDEPEVALEDEEVPWPKVIADAVMKMDVVKMRRGK